MGKQWLWVVRLLGCFMLTPLRVSKGAGIVRRGRLAITVAVLLWTLLYLHCSYLLIWSIIQNNDAGCFEEVIHRTMNVYNVQFVITTANVSAYLTNIFCLARMYRRDLITMIARNVNLYAKSAGKGKAQAFALSTSMKAFIVFIFFSPWIIINMITLLCYGVKSAVWMRVLFASLNCYFSLPSTCMTTVFFILLHTAEESLTLLHNQLMTLYASKTPRLFLESTWSPAPENTSRVTLTASRLHALRMVHYQLVEFMEDVMNHFQTEILVMFLTYFCQTVLYVFSIVFNHKDMFRDKLTFIFVCHSLYMTVKLVTSLWMTCAGPTRIKDKQRDLMNSTSRLSTILNLPSDIVYEIRIFQLQARNHVPSFEVFGLFELSFSLLFSMCATIVSYIVVLLQFADPEQDVEVPLHSTSSVNTTELSI